jgi:collagenase-like PrtC family protease
MKQLNFKYDIPFIFDKEFIIKINEFNNLQLYGSIKKEFPTGRPIDYNVISEKYFKEYLMFLKSVNIKINILINGKHKNYDNYVPYFQLIDDIAKPNMVTISDINLIKYLNEKFQWDFEISAITGIENQKQFYRFNSGLSFERIKGIVFHHNTTRIGIDNEFIYFLVKNDIIPRVLVTESCYKNCPFRKEHYNSFFNVNTSNKSKFVNHFQIFCVLKRLKNPELLIDLSGFLLPEQLNEYNRKTGINHFKITGRSKSQKWIINTTKAYLSGSSPENLFEIIVLTSPFLEEFAMKVQDLFYLNSTAYNELYYELIEQSTPKLRQSFLKEKAAELFLESKLKINDPNSQYDVVQGELKVIKKGDYLKRLESELDNYLISNNLQKLKATFNKSYEKVY